MKRFFPVMTLMVMIAGCAGRGADTGCVISQFLDTTLGADLGVGDNQLGGKGLAQSVYIPANTTVKSVALRLYKKGTIATGHTVILSVEESVADAPAGVPLSSSAEVELSTSVIGESADYHVFLFPSAITVSTAGSYWLVLRGTYAIAGTNDTNLVKWQAHDGVGGYADGKAKYLNESESWVTTEISDLTDLVFQLGC